MRIQPVSQRDFCARHEFQGRLTTARGSLSNLHVIVQYDLRGDGQIEGAIFGNEDTMRSISDLRDDTARYSLRSEHPDQRGCSLRSETVRIPRTSARSWPDGVGKCISEPVAQLEIQDVTIKELVSAKDLSERRLTFYLAGPRELWFSEHLRYVSYTGRARTKRWNTRVPIPAEIPFSARVTPLYLHEEDDNRRELVTDVMALVLKPRAEAAAIPDADLLEIGKTLADDLTLLISFLSIEHCVKNATLSAKKEAAPIG